ncbi:MAG: class I SAM-dependent methyltransferase [bacterium]|nr:class I SAM-dependent methyltransferase [bacterium]
MGNVFEAYARNGKSSYVADEPEFRRLQREYFEAPEVDHFRWTVRGEGFAETEDELLAQVCGSVAAPCLEIGCGEGNNLARLTRHVACVGVDLFVRKLHFAASQIPTATLAVASADQLPFASASFGSVVIRDVLHHMEDPRAVVAEAVRVLAPGGRLWLLEPNAMNPIVALQILLIPAEAGARKFNAGYVASLLDGLPLKDLELDAAQPFPLRRVVLHYQMGIPALGRFAPVRTVLRGIEAVLGALIPKSRWCYVTATARRA